MDVGFRTIFLNPSRNFLYNLLAGLLVPFTFTLSSLSSYPEILEIDQVEKGADSTYLKNINRS
jgi:hypothetical protein